MKPPAPPKKQDLAQIKKSLKRTEFFSLAIILFSIITLIFVFNLSIKEPKVFTSSNTRVINCESNSMWPFIDCNDRVHTSKVKMTDRLELGKIYLYQKPGKKNAIIHTLIACVDKDCNLTVFKGYNNPIGELVNRSDIIEKVEMIIPQ